MLNSRGIPTSAAQFTLLGLVTVPISLVLAVLALWAGARILGY